MGQDDERQDPGRGKGYKKPENNENKNEKTTPKGQPPRVVLKPSSSAPKTTPRIALRTTPKTTPKGSATMRETPPSRKEANSTLRHTYSSKHSTPATYAKESSPATRAKATIRESPLRPVGSREALNGYRQKWHAKMPHTIKPTYETVSKRGSFTVGRKISASSADSLERAPRPKTASIHADAFRIPSSQEASLEEGMEVTPQVEDSPFYADGDLSGDDLESRMRSFLGRRERSRVSRRSEIKSVKWDPAIVACGPLTPTTDQSKPSESPVFGSPREMLLQEPTKDLENSLEKLTQIAADLKKADTRILQQLLEALKNAESSEDTTIIRPKKERVPLSEQKIKVKQNYPTTAATTNTQEGNNTTLIVKGLNPQAPVYRNFTGLKDHFSTQKENKANIPHGGKWPLNIRRKRPHSSEDLRDFSDKLDDPAKPSKYIPPALRTRQTSPSPPKQELQDVDPIWIKACQPFSNIHSQTEDAQQVDSQDPIESYESLIDAPLDPMYALRPPLLARPTRIPPDNYSTSWLTGFEAAQEQQFSQPIFSLGLYEPYDGFGFQPAIFSNHTLSPDWCPVLTTPLPTVPSRQEQLPKQVGQLKKLAKDRKKPLPVNMIPSENAAGRTALALEPVWANQLLDNFKAKYPMTGKAKPLPELTKEKKVATKIQQRLEVLLLYQKEKKAMEDQFGMTPMLPRMVSEASSGHILTDSVDANHLTSEMSRGKSTDNAW